MSIRGALTELEQIDTIATGFHERATRAFDQLDAMAPPRQESQRWLGTPVNMGTSREIRTVTKAWRVSKAAVIRLALHHLFKTYGFDASVVLEPVDMRAVSRGEGAPKPYITSEEAKVRRRKPLVFAKSIRVDDPPQP